METPINPAVLRWFEKERHIEAETVIRTGIYSGTRTGNGAEVIPDPQGQVICFPTYKGDQIIAEKYRGAHKTFWQKPNSTKTFYGAEILDDPLLKSGKEALIVTEGECFPPDVEILTEAGWVKFGNYDGHSRVMAVDENSVGRFVAPTAFIRKPIDDSLIVGRVKGWSLACTPNHRMVAVNNKTGKWYKHAAIAGATSSVHHIPRVCTVDGAGIDLTDDQIALCLALSADATFYPRTSSRARSTRYAKLTFKKQRKVERLAKILGALKIRAAVSYGTQGRTTFQFSAPEWCPGRLLPWAWVSLATAKQREFILQELIYWDGNFVPNRAQTEYSTIHSQNAAVVQALAHTSGRCSSIMERENSIGKWLKVSILHNKKTTSWQRVAQEQIPYAGTVYCVSVSTGMILVRHEAHISVCGNCDMLTARQCGFPFSVSVPDGAPPATYKYNPDGDDNKFSYLIEEWDRLKSIKKIIIAVDDDPPGKVLANELVRRLGKVRCYWVQYPEGCKDLNEVLVKHGPEAVKNVLNAPKPYPVNGLYKLSDYPAEPELKPLSTGWKSLDQNLLMFFPCFMVVTGLAGGGKSTWTNQLVAQMAAHHGWKSAIASFEMRLEPYVTDTLRAVYLDKEKSQWSSHDVLESNRWIENHFVFIAPSADDEEDHDLDWLIERAAAAVIRHGIRILVIDPWNEIEHAKSRHESLTEYTGRAIRSLKKFGMDFDCLVILVAHPTKGAANKDPTDISLYDVSDSAHFANKADLGVVIAREPHSLVTNVITRKVRFQPDTGVPGTVSLSYDPLLRKFGL